GPHGVDEVEHLGVGAVAVRLDAVFGEGFGRAAAALVQGGEETTARSDLLGLSSVHVPILSYSERPVVTASVTGRDIVGRLKGLAGQQVGHGDPLPGQPPGDQLAGVGGCARV